MKRSTAESLKKKTYEFIDNTRELYCTGCGRSDVILTHSHLIPQRRLVNTLKRPELIAEDDLIALHCMDCHVKFENHDPTLLDYVENLAIIEKYDPEQARFIKVKNGEI